MTWQSVRFRGWLPDLPANTPGIFTDTDGVVPTDTGFGNAPYPQELATQALSGRACGATRLRLVDGTDRYFVGTATQLYELELPFSVMGTPTLVNRTGGISSFNASPVTPWTFANFGDLILAANPNDRVQYASLTGVTRLFGDLIGAPKAAIVITPAAGSNAQFAFCASTDNGDGGGFLADQWKCSALGDYTDWTLNPAGTGCTSARLTDLGGPITAAISFRDQVVLFKSRAMYLGKFVGGLAVWDFERISTDVGCIGPWAVTECFDALYFADEQGLWQFDGSYPKPIPAAPIAWWANYWWNARGPSHRPDVTAQLRRQTQVVWDAPRHALWFGYGGDGVSIPHSWIVCNLVAQTWTQLGTLRDAENGNAVGFLLPDGQYAIDAANPGHWVQIQQDAVNSPAAMLRLGVIGGAAGTVSFGGVRPEWLQAPGFDVPFASARCYYGRTMSELASNSVALGTRPDGGFDATLTSNWLQPQISINASTAFAVSSMTLDINATAAPARSVG